MTRSSCLAALVVALPAVACSYSLNYPPDGPRYAVPAAPAAAPTEDASRLRVVTFNVKFARDVDGAIATLREQPALREADVILLQEMDASGAYRIATALGHAFVYYPGALHGRSGRQFGNAVLSRWPITDDAKILLPHVGRGTRTRRVAVAATIQFGPTPVRVYSLHLGTFLEIGGDARRDQLAAVLRDAEGHARVVIGGDLNNHDVGALARRAGYDWPTERGPRTSPLGRWDHIFLRGFGPAGAEATGTVADNRGASDHLPVWVVARPAPWDPSSRRAVPGHPSGGADRPPSSGTKEDHP